MVWKSKGGRLSHQTDERREDLQFRIKQKLLTDLGNLAEEHDTTISYLLEDGLMHMFDKKDVAYSTETRGKGKTYFKASLDVELIREIREIAEGEKIKMTNIIEESVHHINLDTVKKKSHRFRVEFS